MHVTLDVIDLSGLPPGLRLRLRREALRVRQNQLAALVGLSRGRVSDVEHERPASVSHITRIAAVLDALEAGR